MNSSCLGTSVYLAPASVWMWEGVIYKPCALFFQLWGRGGAVLQQHRSRVRDGTPSVHSAFVESSPSAVAQATGGNVCSFEPLLPSASLPFQSFGFLSTSLVLASILTLRLLPSSCSYSRSSGLYPGSQFWAVHPCTAANITTPLTALLPRGTRTLLSSSAPKNGFTGRNICGDRDFSLNVNIRKRSQKALL